MKSAFLKPTLLAMAALAAFTGALGGPGASPAAAQPFRQEAASTPPHGAAFQPVRHDPHWRDRDREADAHRHSGRQDGRWSTDHASRNTDRGHANRTHVSRGRWGVGDRLPPAYRTRGHVILHPAAHHLRRPPRGHHWVQVGGDAILVAAGTGVIAGLVHGLFR